MYIQDKDFLYSRDFFLSVRFVFDSQKIQNLHENQYNNKCHI